MIRSVYALAIAAAFGLAFATNATAQANPYELNVHVGGLQYDLGFDDDDNTDTDVMLGARLTQHFESGWGWGGNFDWVLADEFQTPSGEDIDVNLYLYSGEVNYTFPTTGRAKIFLSGGLGAATLSVSDIPGVDDDFDDTNLMVPLGVGFKWYNDARDPTWAIRGDLRDNIVFGDEEEGEDETDQNFEYSIGVSFVF